MIFIYELFFFSTKDKISEEKLLEAGGWKISVYTVQEKTDNKTESVDTSQYSPQSM